MNASERPQDAQQFTISLEGAELPTEVVDRIHRALHKAVLHEIADIDLAPRTAVRFVGEAGGPTQGLRAEIVAR